MLTDLNPLHTRLDKVDEFIWVYDGTRFLVLFGPKNVILFTIGWDTLLVKKVVLHMLFLIIMHTPKLMLMIN